MTTPPRPTLLDIGIGIAQLVSKRGTCPRLQTGAVIMTPQGQVLSTGYNGAVSGQPHCVEVGCLMVQGSCARAVHAEANAITQAAKLGVRIHGAVLVSTHRPCVTCAKLIIQAGILEVLYVEHYATDGVELEVFDMFHSSRVRLQRVSYGATNIP